MPLDRPAAPAPRLDQRDAADAAGECGACGRNREARHRRALGRGGRRAGSAACRARLASRGRPRQSPSAARRPGTPGARRRSGARACDGRIFHKPAEPGRRPAPIARSSSGRTHMLSTAPAVWRGMATSWWNGSRRGAPHHAGFEDEALIDSISTSPGAQALQSVGMLSGRKARNSPVRRSGGRSCDHSRTAPSAAARRLAPSRLSCLLGHET